VSAGSRHTVAPRRARHHRLISWSLASPLHQLLGRLALLEYTASDGRTVSLPVQYARTGSDLVLAAGGAADKRWWRAFRRRRPAVVLVDGHRHAVTGEVVPHDAPGWGVAAAAYQASFPLARLDDAELVLLHRADRPVSRLGRTSARVAPVSGRPVPSPPPRPTARRGRAGERPGR
jgi:hypothetical protein